MKPTIILGHQSGYHNEHLEEARERLSDSKQYQDLTTVILTPTRGLIPAIAVQSWMFLMGPANTSLGRVFVQGMEVGSAYNSGISNILADPGMQSKLRYICTLEDDNLPPPDGLLRLYENICDCNIPCKEHYVIVAGLYWMKGEMGQPMIFGDPKQGSSHFQPQIPEIDSIQECNGVGMGFTLFHKGLFELEEFPKPWFETVQELDPQNPKGHKSYTQDLFFMEKVRKEGYRIACDTRVKVGHYDKEMEKVW